MRIIDNNSNHKKTILFIPGFRRLASSFNLTDFNKNINIELDINKKCNTFTLELSDENYLEPISNLCDKIYLELFAKLVPNQKILIVAHSNGSFYAFGLAEKYPQIFNKILLLDPTIKTFKYREKLELLREADKIMSYKLENFDILPSGLDLANAIIVRIHVNLNLDALIIDKEKLLIINKITNKNTKSRFVLHIGMGHMIHWMQPDKIKDAIMEML